jgi:hypothetical protein
MKNMKKSRLMPLTLALLSIGILVSISVVHAPWETLGTGYAITTNYHGDDVLPGTPVTVTAGTLDPGVVNVTFRWHMPNDTVRWETTKTVASNGTTGQWNNGTESLIFYANDTQIPDVYGDWGVQVFFRGPNGNEKANVTGVIKIRAESFSVTPEVPLGTIAATLSMLTALCIFALRKKNLKAHKLGSIAE